MSLNVATQILNTYASKDHLSYFLYYASGLFFFPPKLVVKKYQEKKVCGLML